MLRTYQAKGEGCILACSALKQSYRTLLEDAAPSAYWFFLNGPPDLIESRLRLRSDHYMRADMLQSQIRDLEPPIGRSILIFAVCGGIAPLRA